jgi:hypothetical protein
MNIQIILPEVMCDEHRFGQDMEGFQEAKPTYPKQELTSAPASSAGKYVT